MLTVTQCPREECPQDIRINHRNASMDGIPFFYSAASHQPEISVMDRLIPSHPICPHCILHIIDFPHVSHCVQMSEEELAAIARGVGPGVDPAMIDGAGRDMTRRLLETPGRYSNEIFIRRSDLCLGMDLKRQESPTLGKMFAPDTILGRILHLNILFRIFFYDSQRCTIPKSFQPMNFDSSL